LSNNSDLDKDIQALNTFISHIIEKNNISFEDIIEKISKDRKDTDELAFPSNILKIGSLGILESITKYLKENKNLRYNEIAALLNRDARSVWVTYDNSVKKYKKKLTEATEAIQIPISILTNRKLGLLENICVYLKNTKNLTYKEIGNLLARDNRVIWTCYNRAIKK
jgi:hypothetical protein